MLTLKSEISDFSNPIECFEEFDKVETLKKLLPDWKWYDVYDEIESLHEKTSVIITTNKAPTEWAESLNDEVLATALLDRLLYRCEVIKLTGNSYRMENRKTIFSDNKTDNK